MCRSGMVFRFSCEVKLLISFAKLEEFLILIKDKLTNPYVFFCIAPK